MNVATSPRIGEPRRTAWLEIDLVALRHNVSVIAELVGPAVALAPVVKANAYGHGLELVGPFLAEVSDALCVATLDEALALRSAGVAGRVIVLYAVPPSALEVAHEAGIELTLMSATDVEGLLAWAPNSTGPMRIHLAVGTGMSRGGLDAAAALVVARTLQQSRVELVGLWTHLASALDHAVSRAQVERFEQLVTSMRAAGLDMPARHVAASEGLFAGSAPTYELVRPGLAIYGVLEETHDIAAHTRAAASRLRPVMALKARAVAFSDVAAGAGVGYGGTWQAARRSRVAVLPLGYGDGYARATGPGAEVLARGRRLPVVGAISMDAITVDVTDLPGLGYTDEFVLMGSQGDAAISAVELARRRNTIAWEVLSGMAARLPRVYNPSAGSAEGTKPDPANCTTHATGG